MERADHLLHVAVGVFRALPGQAPAECLGPAVLYFGDGAGQDTADVGIDPEHERDRIEHDTHGTPPHGFRGQLQRAAHLRPRGWEE